MTNWPLTKIGDIADVKGGKRLPKGMLVQNEETGYRYIRVTDFTQSGIDVKKIKYITKEAHEKTARYVISDDDVYVSIAGTIGLVGIIPKELNNANLTENAAKICNISTSMHSRFLMYFLRSEYGQGLISAQTVGTSQPKLALFRIKDIEVPKPSLITQERIVSYLSAYDNLIENNNRRIAILEDMAQSLYHEWFVKFRFPGHENVKFKDSPLGQIPEGWEVKAATDVIEFAPKMSLPKDGEKPFVAMPSISTSSMIIGDIEMRTGNSGTKFKNGDTLMARITPCLQNGKVGFVQHLDEENPIGFGSTEFIVMRSKGLTPEFVYCLARSDSFRANAINSMAGADGRQRVKNDCFKSYYLAVPPKDILDQFSALAEPAFKEIFTLSQKNKNLKRQRDMLLPKLISGAIDV